MCQFVCSGVWSLRALHCTQVTDGIEDFSCRHSTISNTRLLSSFKLNDGSNFSLSGQKYFSKMPYLCVGLKFF